MRSKLGDAFTRPRARRRRARARCAPAKASSARPGLPDASRSPPRLRRPAATPWQLIETRVVRLPAAISPTAGASPGFDVFHAQDGISGNALADPQAAQGLIEGFVRTVHHIDSLRRSGVSTALQRIAPSVEADAGMFVVSPQWRDGAARRNFGLAATVVVGNGVDVAAAIVTPPDGTSWRPAPSACAAWERVECRAPSSCPIGGVEERKNTVRSPRGLHHRPGRRHASQRARLIIAGGSLAARSRGLSSGASPQVLTRRAD